MPSAAALCLAVLAASLAPQEPARPVPEERRLPRLDRVTVYDGQALVERVLEVQAAGAGSQRVVLGPFPESARLASFQARVEEGPARVRDLELRRVVGSLLTAGERDRLGQERADLKRRLVALEADRARLDAGSRVLDALIESVAQGHSVSGAVNASTLGAVDEILGFVQERSASLELERARLREQEAELQSKLREIEARLGGGEEPGAWLEARALLDFQAAGAVRLRLSYLVQGARWEPTYDIRVTPDLADVSVVLVAEVVQNSGEDWQDTELLLSTSMPNLGLRPPALPLRVFGPPPEAGSAEAPGRVRPAREAPEVRLSDLGLTSQYSIPGRRRVRSDGEVHRFTLAESRMEVDVHRYVVPSLSTHAFLRAVITHRGEEPLLAGPAKVYVGPDYLGETRFPSLRRGDPTIVDLGIDPNLEVDILTERDEREGPGFLGSEARITRVYRAILRLSANAPASMDVVVEEAIPVSRDGAYEITRTNVQPAALNDPRSLRDLRERGLLRWRLRLAPGQTQNIRWGWIAAFDEDLPADLYEYFGG